MLFKKKIPAKSNLYFFKNINTCKIKHLKILKETLLNCLENILKLGMFKNFKFGCTAEKTANN